MLLSHFHLHCYQFLLKVNETHLVHLHKPIPWDIFFPQWLATIIQKEGSGLTISNLRKILRFILHLIKNQYTCLSN